MRASSDAAVFTYLLLAAPWPLQATSSVAAIQQHCAAMPPATMQHHRHLSQQVSNHSPVRLTRCSGGSRRAVQVCAQAPAAAAAAPAVAEAPLMVRAARGEKVERAPCWMMRQAGRSVLSVPCVVCVLGMDHLEFQQSVPQQMRSAYMPWPAQWSDSCRSRCSVVKAQLVEQQPGWHCQLTNRYQRAVSDTAAAQCTCFFGCAWASVATAFNHKCNRLPLDGVVKCRECTTTQLDVSTC